MPYDIYTFCERWLMCNDKEMLDKKYAKQT